MIYDRFGQTVVIQRLGTLADVKKLDGRKPDKQDRDAVKHDAYVVCSESDCELLLCHVAFLRADKGFAEISAVIEACKKNGGRAP